MAQYGLYRAMVRHCIPLPDSVLNSSESSSLASFCVPMVHGMTKKSTGMIRKPGNGKLAGLWGLDHLKESSSSSLSISQRVSNETSPENNLEDVAIDLCCSTLQETKKVHKGANAQGCSDSERLEELQSGKVGAL
ncbi:LOW QUALITY PROTEIN: visual system homeobox 1 [Molossus nigricans]